MSKQIVYWVTRGHRFTVPENSQYSVEEYKQIIENNGCSDSGDSIMSLEALEDQSECVHFEGCVVEINDH
jgi:hypothetical protein